ncbi:GGDEF domain-containing protein [bacterium]|nr:GGDEF domain-containing protein [bacterium]
MLASNALLLVLDTLTWILDGKPGFLARNFNLSITSLYYILNPLPCMLWSLFADFRIYRDEKRFQKRLLPLLIPLFVNAILTILSFFKDVFFYIDANNIYHRGKLFFVFVIIGYFYFIYTFVQIILKRRMIRKNDYIPLVMFAIPPFIGGLIQSMFYGISLLWISVTISLLIVFLDIQNDQLYTDHLTGLYNRRQLDKYLMEQVKDNTRNNILAGIMIDVNSFKMINDVYGHVIGDQALEYTGEILKKSIRKDDFIARYGGDEFAIIIEVEQRSDLVNTVNRIRENAEQFNAQKIAPYNINLSIGYDIFDLKSGMTIQQFLKNIDSLMYEDKRSKTMQDKLEEQMI